MLTSLLRSTRTLCAALALRTTLALLALALAPALHATYKGGIVMDAATGKVLFEQAADTITPPASVTKLMTFLLVHEAINAGQLRLSTPVPITTEDAKTGGTQVWLDPRETFTVEELLYALMIQSANDAASALARATSGSREAFVQLMNTRARELGMTQSTFRSPHGLPPSNRKVAEGDLTSPRDLALLSRELVLHTDVLRYTSTRQADFGTGKRPKPVIMNNHNRLLRRVAGVDGLKTGFTNAAGFCLATTAQRGDYRLIVVVMGSPSSKERDRDVTALLEKYFPLVPATSVFHGPPVSPVSATQDSASAPAATGTKTSTPGPAATPPAKNDDEVPSVKFTPPPRK